MAKKHIFIAAGGTGGHVFPALAVALKFRDEGYEVIWLGTKSGLEANVAKKHQFKIIYLAVYGLRQNGFLRKLMAPFFLSLSLIKSLGVTLAYRPVVVLGFGGYVSGPVGLAAWLLRRPLVIHEQNAKAGLSNRILAKFAKRVLQGFPGAFPKSSKSCVTGNPVRDEFNQITKLSHDFDGIQIGPVPFAKMGRAGKLEQEPLNILVVGGSQGAATLNKIIPQALSELDKANRPTVYHQAGSAHLQKCKQNYRANGVEADVSPFIEDMAKAYEWADLVICRAGALTVAEVAAAGVAAVFIPYPHAVDNHQYHNAQYLAKKDAAVVIKEKDLNKESLLYHLKKFLNNPQYVRSVGDKAKEFAKPDAASTVVQECLRVVS